MSSQSFLTQNYSRLPVSFSHGQNSTIWDTNGKSYIDALAGIAVNTLGHNHPILTAALQKQVSQLIHTSNMYGVPLQEHLAEKLCKISGMQEAVFVNSGSEANETAIKLARLYGTKNPNKTTGQARYEIIVMEHAWHGRTLATLAATGNPKAKEGFGPLPTGFNRIAYNDISALKNSLTPTTVSVLLEVLQGEGGIRLIDWEYLKQVREFCDEHDLLLMIDEVQSGIGRTGTWFGYQNSQVMPDVITVAKGLGSGVPIGGCLARGKAAGVFTVGTHGSTFGGNPLACQAGLTTLNVIKQDNLMNNAINMGNLFKKLVKEQLDERFDIRGEGLMLGISCPENCPEIALLALEAGILCNVTQGHVVRILPPLIITETEITTVANTLVQLLKKRFQ